ncbi:MAG: DUF3795 domain-containing protein [Clostridia bacterium]|nr:DUF3795 domain-containing protein [Clostridia bacterium]
MEHKSFEHMAYCGFDCGGCPMFRATVDDDAELRAKLIEKYSTPEKQLTADDVKCFGCKAAERYVHPYCNECAIRCCAVSHGIGFNCGECAEYPCGEIVRRIPENGQSRANMDEVNANRANNRT